MTEAGAVQLAIEFPAFFTLPRAARERVGFLVGQVCFLHLCMYVRYRQHLGALSGPTQILSNNSRA